MSFPTEVPVVVAASAAWETPAPVNAHQVARRLAERGHQVLFVESTGLRAPAPAAGRGDLARMATRLGSFVRGVQPVAPRLHVLSPLALPGAGPPALRRRSLSWVAAQTARAARRLGMVRPVLWAFLPTAVEMPARIGARLCVYHCVDHYSANPGVDARWIDALEAAMLAAADLVFATSPVLARRLEATRTDVITVPNVADVGLFSRAVSEALPEPTELADLPRPRIVYVGNLAGYRIDFEWLLTVGRALPTASLVLLGARGLGDVSGASPAECELVKLPNVRVVDARPQGALPAYLRHCDVALIPFLDNDHTRASLPLKLWEYLAAGLPVAARDLPNLRAEAEPWIHTARDADGFVAAVRAALDEPAERRRERSDAARAHDWPLRMETLCEAVSAALAEGGGETTPL